MIRKILFAVIAFSFISASASAAPMETFYSGIRPLAMGNAFTAVSNDENAVFYNPAGLGSVKSGRIELLPPLIEYSQNMLELGNEISNIDTNNISGTVDTLRKYVGKNMRGRVSVFPNYTKKNFEIGFLENSSFEGEVRQPSYPYINAKIKSDAGLVAGIARSYSVNSQKLQIGISGKIIQRRGLNKRYTAVDLSNQNYKFENDLKTGVGIGVNLGAIYTVARLPLKPSFGLSIRNIGGMGFGKAGIARQSVNLGMAFNRKLGPVPLTVAFDYVDILGGGTPKRLHVGMEADLIRILTLRAGLNQGYLTYGALIDLWILQLEYAAYTEEVGAYAGQKKDQRHVFQLVLGW